MIGNKEKKKKEKPKWTYHHIDKRGFLKENLSNFSMFLTAMSDNVFSHGHF